MNNNKPDEVIEIIKTNETIDYSFQTNWPIRWAIYWGFVDIVKLLIQHPKVKAKLTEKEIEEYEKY